VDKEIWKDIPDYEGSYQASTHGRVRSLDSKDSMGRKFKGLVLRPSFDKYKKARITLYKNRVPFYYTRAALILLTFLSPRPNSLQICHKDGNASNDRLSNLRYDTRKNNIKHRKSLR